MCDHSDQARLRHDPTQHRPHQERPLVPEHEAQGGQEVLQTQPQQAEAGQEQVRVIINTPH